MNTQKCDPLLLPFVTNVLECCNAGQLEAIFERAAMLEFEANCQPRALAEALAVLDLLHQAPQLLSGLVALEVELDGATQWLLTSNLPFARQHLLDIGGKEIAVLDPLDVVRRQFGDVAMLCTLG